MRKNLIMKGAAAGLLLAMLAGCSPAASGMAESSAAESSQADSESEVGSAVDGSMPAMVMIEDEEIPLAALIPQASGMDIHENNKVTLDISNSSQGYCMVKYSGNVGKIKVQISKGSLVYTYDLNARSSYETFPFSEGDGTYSIKVFENVTGNQYSQAFSKDVSVNLASAFSPFLYPNQYVNFSANSAAVQTGAQIAQGAQDQIGIVVAIYDYVVNNLTYDTAKAASVSSGYLPNVDQVLAAKTGICFDYAALMTAMLRSQGVPTKLVVGYTGDVYHAWISVYIQNVGWVDDFIYFDGQNWQLMDPTFASTGKQSESVKQYIGNGANYQAKYSY